MLKLYKLVKRSDKMKPVILLAVVAGCLSVPIDVRVVNQASHYCAQKCLPTSKFKYRPGTSYDFRYEAETTTGIQGATKHHSKMRITAIATVEVHNACNFVLRLKQVRLLSTDPNNQRSLKYAPGTREFKRAIERFPLKFAFQDGRIENICPNKNEPLWSLNIKRGCLSVFQNSMHSLHTDQKVKESDITGDCNAEYTVKTRGWYVTNIKKTKDLLGCAHYQGYNTAVHGISPNTPNSGIRSLPLLKSTHECDQSINTYNGHLKSSHCRESHLFRPFSKNESGAVTHSTQTLTFEKHYPSISRLPYGRDEPLSVHFEHANNAGYNTAMRMREALSQLRDICVMSRDDVRPDTPAIFASLVHTLRDLDLSALKTLNRHVQGNNLCRVHPERARKFFMDAVPMIGSSASVHLISDMIADRRVQGVKAKMWLASLAFIAQPTAEMLRSLRPLLIRKTTSTALLSISALINNFCRKTPGICEHNPEITGLIALYGRKLGSRCETFRHNREEVLVTLRALGNTGNALRLMPTLNNCLVNRDLPIEARIAVTVAYRHMACEADKNELLTVFRNHKEDAELRIMSYLAVMQCPNMHDLQQVQQALASENVNQVGSFVWSHLTNLMETSNPHKQEIREILDNDDLKKEFDFDRRKYSRNYEASFFLKSLNTGASFESNLIWSPRSFVPRSAMANITVDLFGHSVNLFEIGGRVEGTEKLLEEIFGPKGFMKTGKKTRRPSLTHKMRRINENFGRKRERLSGSAYIRIFGNELSYLNLDSNLNIGDLFTFGKTPNDDIFHWSQNIMLLDSTLIVPTSSGLPLNLTVNASASVDLKLSSHKKSTPHLELFADIRPSGAVQFATQMSVDAYVTRVGMKMVSTLHTSTKTKVKVKFENGMKFEMETPNEKMEIIDFSTQFFMIHHNADVDTQLMDANRRDHSWCSGAGLARITGLEVCSQISVPGITVNTESPSFPLAGPIKMGVSLFNRDRHTSYTFLTVAKSTPSEVSFVTSFNTPGSQVDRHVEVNFMWNKEKNAVDINLISPWKKVAVSGMVTNLADLRRFKGNMMVDESRQYSVLSQLQVDRDASGVKYLPTLEVTIHGQPSWGVKGVVEHNKGKKMALDLSTDFYEDHPMGIRAAYENGKRAKTVTGRVQFGKGMIYSVDSKLAHSIRKKTKIYKPSLSIKTPNRELINIASSLTHKPRRTISVKFKLDKVFIRPVIFDTQLRLVSSKGRQRYVALLDIESQIMSMKLSGYMDRRAAKGLTSTRMRLSYNIPKVSKDSVTINGKFRNRGIDGMARHRLSLSMDMAKNTQNNFKLDHDFTWNKKNLEADVDFHYGPNYRDQEKRVHISKRITFTNNKNKLYLSYNLQTKYLAMDLDAQLKGTHYQTDKKISMSTMLRVNPKQIYTINFKYENPSSRLWQRKTFFSVSNVARTVRFESDLTRLHERHYVSSIDFQWDKTKKASIQSTVKLPSDTRYEITSTIDVTKKPTVVIDGRVNLDKKNFEFSTDLKKDRSRYGILISSRIPNSGYIGKVDLMHPDRRIIAEVNGDWRSKYTGRAEVKWNAIKDEDARLLATADIDYKDIRDIEGSVGLQFMKRDMRLNLKHKARGQYSSHIDLKYAPYKVITLDTSFDRRHSWYEKIISASLSMTTPCQYWRKFSIHTKSTGRRLTYTNDIKIELNDVKPIQSRFMIQKPWSWKDLKTNLTLTGPSFSLKGAIHHKLSNEIHSKVKGEINNDNVIDYVDFSVNGKNKGNSHKNDISGDVSFKSSLKGLETVGISLSHMNNRRTIRSESQANLAALGVYKYELNMNHYLYMTRLVNNGRLYVTTPIKGYKVLETTWNHRNTDKMLESKGSSRVESNVLSYNINAKHANTHFKKEATGTINIQTPINALKEFDFTVHNMIDTYHNTVTSKITMLRNRFRKTGYEFNFSQRDKDIATDFMFVCPGMHPITTKISTRFSSQPKTANMEFKWSQNKKIALDGTASIALPHFLEGNVQFSSPFVGFEKITGNIRHTHDRGEWVSTGGLMFAHGKINLQSSMRFTEQPKLDFQVTTPYRRIQLMRVAFTHSGDFKTSANTKASFNLHPVLGEISATSSWENGKESTGRIRVETPFQNYKYMQVSGTFTKGYTKSIDVKLEYKPQRVVHVMSEFRFTDLRDIYMTVTMTSLCPQVPFFKYEFSHRGDIRQFQCKASYEFPQYKVTEARINFSQYRKIEGSASVKTPYKGFEDLKAQFHIDGSMRDFHSHAEITSDRVALIDTDITFSLANSEVPKVELEAKVKPTKLIRNVFLRVSHVGTMTNFLTDVTGQFGRESLSQSIHFSTKNQITASTTLNARSRLIPFNTASVSFTHKGVPKDFTSEFKATYDEQTVNVILALDLLHDKQASIVITTPLKQLRNVELALNHVDKSRWHDTEFNTVATVKIPHFTKGDVIKTTVNFKYMPNRKIDVLTEIKTPYSGYEDLSSQFKVQVRRDTSFSDLKTHIQYMTGQRISFDGSIGTSGGLRTMATLLTPFDGYKEMTAAFNIDRDYNNFDGHVKYSTKKRIDVSGSVTWNNFKISAQTPYTGYEDLSASGKIDKHATGYNLNGHIQYTSLERIEGSVNMDYPKSFNIRIKTPFQNYEDVSAAYNLRKTDKQYVINSHIQYASGKRIDITINALCYEKLDIDIRSPFENYGHVSAVLNVVGEPLNFRADGFINYNNNKRINIVANLQYPSSISVSIKTPFQHYEHVSAAINIDKRTKSFNLKTHLQYASSKRIEFTTDVKFWKEFEVTLKTPYVYVRDVAIKAHYHKVRNSITSGGHVKYDSNKRIHINAEMDIPSKVVINVGSPFSGYESISTSGHLSRGQGHFESQGHLEYAAGKRINFVAKVNTKNGIDSLLTITSPIQGYEDLSASAKIIGNRKLFDGYAHIQYANRKKISAEVDADLRNGLRTKWILKTPFEGWESIEAGTDIRGNRKIFSGKAHVEYAPLKRIELSGNIDLKRRTEGSLKLTTPFKDYEELSASGDVDGRLKKFRVTGHVEYSPGKKIEFKTKVNLHKKYDIRGSLRTPFKNFEELSMETGLDGNWENFDASAAIQYARNKRIAVRQKLDIENSPATVFTMITTPFADYTSNQFRLSTSGVPAEFKTTASLESTLFGTVSLDLSNSYRNVNQMRSSISLTSKIPRFENIQLSVSNSKQANGLYSHSGRFTWDNFNTISAVSTTKVKKSWYAGSNDISHSLSINTPFKILRTLSTEASYESSRQHYFSKLQTVLNSKKIVDATGEYKDKTLSFIVKEPHPAKLTVSGDLKDKAVNGEIFVNWNADQYDQNVRIKGGCEDEGNYYSTKKSCKLDITNPRHRVAMDTGYQSSSRHMFSHTSVSYNDKQVDYDVKLFDRSRRYSRTFNYDGSLRVGTPIRALELSGSHTKTSASQKNDLTLMWDARRDRNKKVVVVSDVKLSTSDHEGTITLKLPHINKEMSVKSKLALNRGRVLMDGQLQFLYDRDDRKTVTLTSRIEDHALRYGSFNYTLTAAAQHPASRINIQLNSHLGRDADRMSAALFSSVYYNKKMENAGVRAEIDTRRRSIDFLMKTPVTKIGMSGHVRKNVDYQVHLMNTFTHDERPFKTKLTINPTTKNIALTFNHDLNNPSNLVHLHAGFVGPRKLSAQLWRIQNYKKIRDASVIVTLNSSRLIHTSILWRPSLLRDVEDVMQLRTRDLEEAWNRNLDWLYDLSSGVASHVSEKISDTLDYDLAPAIKHVKVEAEAIINDIDDIFTKLQKIVNIDVSNFKIAPPIQKAYDNFIGVSVYILLFPDKILTGTLEWISLNKEHPQRLIADTWQTVSRLLRRNMIEVQKTFEFYEAYFKRLLDIGRDPTSRVTGLVIRQSSRIVQKAKGLSMRAINNIDNVIKSSLEQLRQQPYLRYLSMVSRIFYTEVTFMLKYIRLQQRIKNMVISQYGELIARLDSQVEHFKNTILNLDKTRMIIYDPENGEIMFELFLPIRLNSLQEMPHLSVKRYLKDLRNSIRSYLPKYWSPWDVYYMYKPASWNPATWIPPFTAHAIQAGRQHFVTFDGRHYDFAGICSYILAVDYIDESFMVIMNFAPDRWNVRKKSITVFVGPRKIEISTDYQVTVDRRPVEMPVKVDSAWVRRVGGRIVVTSPHGYTVDCDIAHDMYTVSVTGWYFGKIGGMLGTYNNEPDDDLITSRRQKAESITQFANSWEVARSCGSTRNFAIDTPLKVSSTGYAACHKIFTSSWSVLRNCFKQIDTAPYIEKCLEDHRFATSHDDTNTCNSTMLYVQQCARAGIKLAVPTHCVRCLDPRGEEFTSTERMTLKAGAGTVPRSADVIFVVQEAKCLVHSSQRLDRIASSIDRQLRMQRFRELRYGLVGYGGHDDRPHSHTLDGQLMNNIRTLASSVRSLEMTQHGNAADTLSAVSFAANYPFRTGVSKIIVLLTCDDCKKGDYSAITSQLKEQAIVVFLLKEKDFDSRTNSVPKIVGSDTGRSTDRCSLLAEATGGKSFDITALNRGHHMLRHAVLSNIAKNVAVAAAPCPCQNCQCIIGQGGIHHAVCTPCRESTPSRILNYIINWKRNETSPKQETVSINDVRTM